MDHSNQNDIVDKYCAIVREEPAISEEEITGMVQAIASGERYVAVAGSRRSSNRNIGVLALGVALVIIAIILLLINWLDRPPATTETEQQKETIEQGASANNQDESPAITDTTLLSRPIPGGMRSQQKAQRHRRSFTIMPSGSIHGPLSSTGIRIIHPNGGEALLAGQETTIYWTGTEPGLEVQVDYSTDAGATWNYIPGSTTDTFLVWTPPAMQSGECLVRLTGREVGELDSLELIGHGKWVNSAALSPSGNLAATNSDDLTTWVWNFTTG